MRKIAFVGLLAALASAPSGHAQNAAPGTTRAIFAADFNGDDFPDLLAQAEDGTVTLSINRGVGFFPTEAALDNVPTPLTAANGCRVVGLGTFNGDALPDPVCQGRSGAVLVWLNNGANAPSRRDVYTGVSDWHVVAIADIDRNGTSDLLWQSPTGRVVVWLMQGTTLMGVPDIWPSASVWRLAGAADFNVDGDADLVWQSPSGTVVVWLMHGTVHMSTVNGPVSVRESNQD